MINRTAAPVLAYSANAKKPSMSLISPVFMISLTMGKKTRLIPAIRLT